MILQNTLLKNIEKSEGLARLWTVLPTARLVGGSVRDLLCGRKINDLDLATPEPPERVQELLEAAGITNIPTGISHGTITAIINREPYEITTLRRDEETDGRHAVVAWTSDWKEDAARRDFTINAMSLDQNGVLYDYFHGQEDLEAGHVRFVGTAEKRIEEDALRALRFFRFYARYGEGAPDREAYQAIQDHLNWMDGLSAERIASELLKILAGPRVMETLRPMDKCGLLPHLLKRPDLVSLERLLNCDAPVDSILRLAALYPDNLDVGVQLKLSNADKKRLTMMRGEDPVLELNMSDHEMRRLRFKFALQSILDKSWLTQAQRQGHPDQQWSVFREALSGLEQPVFPLSGKDAQDAGIPAGRFIGMWLQKGQEWWMAQGCVPNKDECLTYLKNHPLQN
ncbi:CCA tRNA nucleotidyltransferase [Swingsia samuiensis]|uniref:CCA tRNA nucleotidyltransferase n=1 Tax=Swingsia samuiensis TaxID=1293412 RepID=A0A4Y6UJ77_9PROT|nr:CCA tRNA nucleotidyltransferase [Swingsia samuiensis]QDH16441.1 CCA tRNA nucleotidyltransferase [Swingsia samuiensis]